MRETRGLFDGLRIGLLGGSFNPAHNGHREISLWALRKMQLDYVWWLVTPGNPQKNKADYAPYKKRLEQSAKIAAHPFIHVSAFEAEHHLTYTKDTLSHIVRRFPKTRFVWLMGADSFTHFHTWKDWKNIAGTMPLAIFNRPHYENCALSAPAAQAFQEYRKPPSQAKSLLSSTTPAWIFFPSTLNPLSSTKLRRRNSPEVSTS